MIPSPLDSHFFQDFEPRLKWKAVRHAVTLARASQAPNAAAQAPEPSPPPVEEVPELMQTQIKAKANWGRATQMVNWAANKRFDISWCEFKFPKARTYEMIGLVLGCIEAKFCK